MSELVFIGTSDAFGAGGRRQSAVFVRGERGGMLLDCGGTTNTGLTQLGISRNEIDVILISHFHGDHFSAFHNSCTRLCIPMPARRPLKSLGHPRSKRGFINLRPQWGIDSAIPSGRFRSVSARSCLKQTVAAGPAEISAFATEHQPDAHPQGYRVRLGREQIAYSGDTGWFAGLPSQIAGSDLFICECTLHDASLDFHLSLEQLREHRDDLDCGRLILTHLGEGMQAQRGKIELETADDGLAIKL